MIVKVEGREILDSRGNPTVSAVCELSDGSIGEASVPSGASTGKFEAKELRDGDNDRFGGLGVLSVVEKINNLINPKLKGRRFSSQKELDLFLCFLDGTTDKSQLGANGILAVSMAFSRARAVSNRQALYEYLESEFGFSKEKYRLPVPMFNILNGGKHSDNKVDIQETMIVPTGPKKFSEKLQLGAEIYHELKRELHYLGYSTGLGDEGGFAPELKSNEEVFEILSRIIKEMGLDHAVKISTDVAATSFWNKGKKSYKLRLGKKNLSSTEMIKLLSGWAKKYSLLSIEDGLSEEDPSWKLLHRKLKDVIVIGDDLFVTNPEKIRKGAKDGLANGVIIKPNQIGTITESFEAILEAKRAKMKVVVSHRSGETEDSFIADLAVAARADFIKSGAPARSERLSKYNRILEIEEELLGRNKR